MKPIFLQDCAYALSSYAARVVLEGYVGLARAQFVLKRLTMSKSSDGVPAFAFKLRFPIFFGLETYFETLLSFGKLFWRLCEGHNPSKTNRKTNQNEVCIVGDPAESESDKEPARPKAPKSSTPKAQKTLPKPITDQTMKQLQIHTETTNEQQPKTKQTKTQTNEQA